MKTTPYWWEDAAPEHGERELAEDACEALIVGAGYTGLSAAITLAEAGAGRIIVVDAMRIGEGASSRNGGQIGNAPKFDRAYALRKLGNPRGDEIIEDYARAMPFLLERAQSLTEPFDLHLTGAVTGLHTHRDLRRMQALRQSMPPARRDQFEVLDSAGMHRALATDIYRGVAISHDQGGLHPAKYVRALAHHARSLGVRIVTGWRYMGASAEAPGHRARLVDTKGRRGDINAAQILLAVNGYAGPELGWLRQRTIPVQSYMIATAPLPFDQMESLIPGNRVVADTKHILYYFRRSPDGTRMLFGGRARFRTSTEAQSAIGLRAFMAHTFPSLAKVEITHSWLGNVCFAYDFCTHIGRMPDGICYSSCYNGNGISMATYMGHRAAQMMLGVPGHDRGVVNTNFPKLPFYDGNPWFLPLVGNWYRLQDRVAQWRDRP